MRIRYEVTVEDLIAFSLYHHEKSPTLRRARLGAVLSLGAVMIGLSMIAAEVVGNLELLWFGIAGAIVIMALYPRLWRRNVKLYNVKLYAEGQNKGVLGQHVAELRDNGMFDGTGFSERLTFWKGIERIESIPSYTFLYVSAMGAHVIPEKSTVEGNYQQFVDELRRRWQQAHGDWNPEK